MRPTHCKKCKEAIDQPARGVRIYCHACAGELRHARQRVYSRRYHYANREACLDYAKGWYASKRKNNRKWKAENKRRAKAWRERNKDHIKTYNSTVRPALDEARQSR